MKPEEMLDKIDKEGFESFLEDFDYHQVPLNLETLYAAYKNYMKERVSFYEKLEREVGYVR